MIIMTKPKYKKGEHIRSLDELVRQEKIWWNGRVWDRTWFMNLQIGTLHQAIKWNGIYYAVRRCDGRECRASEIRNADGA